MIVLYDDAHARHFEPFASSRPLGEVRAGALLGRERWALWFGREVAAFLSGAHLTHFGEFDAPPMASLPLPAGTWLVNSRALPRLDQPRAEDADVVLVDGRVAAVRLRDVLPDPALRDGTLRLESVRPVDAVTTDVGGHWLDEPWDIIRHLTEQLSSDIPAMAAHLRTDALPHVIAPHAPAVLGTHAVYAERGARVEPFVVFDTTAGPVLIRQGAVIHAFTRIVGPCYVGQDTTVTTDRIAACSIGDQCRVHGELSMSVFIGHANKGHDGFVGHSILGRWVNLGAGTITSNLKNTYGRVAMWSTTGVRDTGLQFVGTFFGDHAKTGIGLRLTTGCVLGVGANVMDSMPPKVVAPFSWGTRAPYGRFDAAKFVDIATRMMARRQVEMDERMRQHLADVMTHTQASPYWGAS